MSLMPDFEIGLWNAWIPVIYWVAIPFILVPLINKETFRKIMVASPADKTKKMIMNIGYCMTFAVIIYSIFPPLKLGTMWFYMGLFIFLLGATIYTIAIVNYATTPLDKLVTMGVYRISKHPIHFSYFILK